MCAGLSAAQGKLLPAAHKWRPLRNLSTSRPCEAAVHCLAAGSDRHCALSQPVGPSQASCWSVPQPRQQCARARPRCARACSLQQILSTILKIFKLFHTGMYCHTTRFCMDRYQKASCRTHACPVPECMWRLCAQKEYCPGTSTSWQRWQTHYSGRVHREGMAGVVIVKS